MSDTRRSESTVPTIKRPSKRKAVPAVAYPSSSSHNEGEEEIDDDREEDYWEATPRKHTRLRKGGGRVRVASSPSDAVEADAIQDSEVTKLHRGFCEKCRLGPANDLLAAAVKKKKRAGKKKQKVEDDDEISEVEAAKALQGWVDVSRHRS
jgi:hypothetical protein